MLESFLLYGLVVGVFMVVAVMGLFYRYMATSRVIRNRQQQQQKQKYHELTILLGSGGHTGQLSLMLKNLHFHKLNKLNVLITSTDKSSQLYFENLFKQEISQQKQLKHKVVYYTVSRTNQVKQNYITAVFTTLKSMIDSIELIRNHLINTTSFISNGPGTCVPFFYLFFILNKLKITKTKLIFIESWCRVNSISLSGKIVKYFADKFLVHWQQQKLKYPWTQYQGKIL